MNTTRSSTTLAILAAAATGLFLAPGTAVAVPGNNVIVNSQSAGSQAQFRHADEWLFACDLKADGMRATAVARWIGAGGAYHRVEVEDTDGANGNCAGARNLDIVEGITVTITACDRNGPNGGLRNCASENPIT